MNIREFINPKELKIIYFTNYINIINYDEIILLTDNKILLLKDKKTITIKGDNLLLNKLLDKEITENPVAYPSQEVLNKCETFIDLGDKIKLYDRAWIELKSE